MEKVVFLTQHLDKLLFEDVGEGFPLPTIKIKFIFTGRTKPFRGDEPPLERLFTNFLSKATESYKERLWSTDHR